MNDDKNIQGKRVRLIRCNDPHTKLQPGTEGTVALVDCVGTLHVDWDDGSSLGLCRDDGDRWQVL
jgi:hypothetical protein